MKRRIISPLLILLLSICLSGISAIDISGRRIKTRLKAETHKEKPSSLPDPSWIEIKTDCDSTADYAPGMISYAGYDKEAQANHESFFITNHTDRRLMRIELTIVYNTLDGRRLHRREVTVNTEVEPGETKRADIPSWDRQHTFYYHRGNAPRKKATPYEVAFSTQRIYLSAQ